MKKYLISVLILFIIHFQGAAQELEIGVKAGLNLANLTGDISDDFSTRTAFHGGVMAEFGITELLSLQSEILYSLQGTKDDSSDNEKLRNDYLLVPVLGKYYVSDEFNLQAGPQFGVLLSAISDIDGEDVDFTKDLKSFDVGLALGLGYKLNNSLNIDARYTLGLSNINDVDGLGDVKNSLFQLSVGYFF